MGSKNSSLAVQQPPNSTQAATNVSASIIDQQEPSLAINDQHHSTTPTSLSTPTVPLIEFTCFSRLPFEIRLQIWEQAIPLAPRILESNERKDPNDKYTPRYLSILQSQLSAVCFESRQVAATRHTQWKSYNIQAISEDMSVLHFGAGFHNDDFTAYVVATKSLGKAVSTEALGATKVLIIECHYVEPFEALRSLRSPPPFPNFGLFAKELLNLTKIIVTLGGGARGLGGMKGDLKLVPVDMANLGDPDSRREFMRGMFPTVMDMQSRRRRIKRFVSLEFVEFEEMGAGEEGGVKEREGGMGQR